MYIKTHAEKKRTTHTHTQETRKKKEPDAVAA